MIVDWACGLTGGSGFRASCNADIWAADSSLGFNEPWLAAGEMATGTAVAGSLIILGPLSSEGSPRCGSSIALAAGSSDGP